MQQKTFHCHAGHGNVTLADCSLCLDYKPFGPDKITRVELPPHSFNASIFEDGGKLRLCWRQQWAGSNLWIADLGEDLQPQSSPIKLDCLHPLSRAGREDPRVFRWQGRLHVSFAGVQLAKGRTIVHQMLARLDEKGAAVEKVWCPEYAERNWWEKNWGCFDHEGELHSVYTISPHVVLKDGGERHLHKVAETAWNPRWSGGALRGGASPVRVGDEYWSFFHGALDQPGRHPARVYSLGLYTFESKPPFRPLRYSPEPLLWPPEESRPPSLPVSVVFACGAVRRGDKWLISYGLHDQWVEVAEFDHAGIERQLVKA